LLFTSLKGAYTLLFFAGINITDINAQTASDNPGSKQFSIPDLDIQGIDHANLQLQEIAPTIEFNKMGEKFNDNHADYDERDFTVDKIISHKKYLMACLSMVRALIFSESDESPELTANSVREKHLANNYSQLSFPLKH